MATSIGHAPQVALADSAKGSVMAIAESPRHRCMTVIRSNRSLSFWVMIRTCLSCRGLWGIRCRPSAKGSVMAIAESLTNIAGAPLADGLSGVSLSANWMWPCKNAGEGGYQFESYKLLYGSECRCKGFRIGYRRSVRSDGTKRLHEGRTSKRQKPPTCARLRLLCFLR